MTRGGIELSDVAQTYRHELTADQRSTELGLVPPEIHVRSSFDDERVLVRKGEAPCHDPRDDCQRWKLQRWSEPLTHTRYLVPWARRVSTRASFLPSIAGRLKEDICKCRPKPVLQHPRSCEITMLFQVSTCLGRFGTQPRRTSCPPAQTNKDSSPSSTPCRLPSPRFSALIVGMAVAVVSIRPDHPVQGSHVQADQR